MLKLISLLVGLTIIVTSMPALAEDDFAVQCKVGEEVGQNYEFFDAELNLADNYKANVARGIKGAWARASSTYSSRIDQVDWEVSISLIESKITRSPLIEVSIGGKDRTTKKLLTKIWTVRGSISDIVEIYPLLEHRGISVKCAAKKFGEFLKQL